MSDDSDRPVKMFLSYARNDDDVPPRPKGLQGFVTCLYQQLTYGLKDLGPPVPDVWIDRENVPDGAQFNPRIDKALREASFFLVILSRHWPERPYCRKELELFREYWRARGEDDFQIRHRIIIVGKNAVDKAKYPDLFDGDTAPLGGQTGFNFFEMRGAAEQLLFFNGRARGRAFFNLIEEVSAYLRTRALGDDPELVPDPEALTMKRAPVASQRLDRTVYLAKPSPDMVPAYGQIARELAGWGFDIVPPIEQSIPTDPAAAAEFIDKALDAAELSIHLVGNDGATPADPDDLLKLQLQRAGGRVKGDDEAGFRRIIWAPKVLEGAASSNGEAVRGARNPVSLLSLLDHERNGDQIIGDSHSGFVTFLRRNLETPGAPKRREEETKPQIAAETDGSSREEIYIYHSPEDWSYALNVAKALLANDKKNVKPRLPARNGTEQQREDAHRQLMQECDSVMLCWAGGGTDAWAISSSLEVKNWRQLGRTRKFARRGFVIGPPPDDTKTVFAMLRPSEIDILLNLTDKSPQPSSADLDPFFASAAGP